MKQNLRLYITEVQALDWIKKDKSAVLRRAEDYMYITDQHLIILEGRELEPVINDSRVSVVLIYASWCPFCVRFLPVFQKYASGNGHYFFAQDDRETLADQYGIEVVPTVLAFQNGTVIGRLDGAYGMGLTEAQLGEFVKRVLMAEPNF